MIKNLGVIGDKPTGAQIDAIMRLSLEPMRREIDDRAPRPSLKNTAVTVRRAGVGRYQREYWISFRGMGLLVAHLLEFGTHPHSMARGASRRRNLLQDRPPWHPGTRPYPFVRPAYETKKDEVIETFGRYVFGGIAGLFVRGRQ